MTTINTNVMSMNAQRNLMSSQGSLATSMQRLSSGLRVNSAKDDAAGLAISERMNAQVRGMNVAARNANDGISLAQTAEGALGKVGDMLQRVRELAVQSANGTNSETDRASLQAEAQQLKDEIDRVANQTSFNGTKLLDGDFTSVAFQVGANQGETISIDSIADTNIAVLGTYQSTEVTGAAPAAAGAIAADVFQINGENVGAIAAGADVAGQAVNVVAAINLLTSRTGVTATVGAANVVNLSNLNGETIVVAGTVTNTGLTAASTAANTDNVGFEDLDISTADGANRAILAMDAALTAVNDSRGELGAVQSRFENAIATINVTAENLAAARGRIVDADFAKETANLSRAQILQQAGTAMVAQANQAPQGVLSLLR